MKAVWAVDCKEAQSEVSLAGKKMAQFLTQNYDCQIFPVTLFERGEDEEEAAIKELKDRFQEIDKTPLEVLSYLKSSSLNPYHQLMEFTQAKEADFLLLSTHAHRGVSRMIFGSFFERLLEEYLKPVLVVSPQMKISQKFDEILFPTDFSKGSKKVFQSALTLAQEMRVPLSFCHHKNHLEQIEVCEEWKKLAEEAGVSVRFHFIEDHLDIAESVLEFCTQKKSPLIALSTHVGRRHGAEQSVARKLIRHSCLPVWVCRE